MECKSELRPSQFSQLTGRHFSPPGKFKQVVPVLALPWVSPRLQDLCREHGWSWFDLAGNHRLDVPDFLLLLRSGNEPVHERPRATANLSTPDAGRVLRALLLPDNAGMGWTQREVQNHCQPKVSLGLVNKVVRHLQGEAFIEKSDDGFRLREPLKLLFAWRDAYRFDRHERRSYFTLLQGKNCATRWRNSDCRPAVLHSTLPSRRRNFKRRMCVSPRPGFLSGSRRLANLKN